MTSLPVQHYDEFKAQLDVTIRELRTTLQETLDGVYAEDGPMLQYINIQTMAAKIAILETQLATWGSAYSQIYDNNNDLVAQRDEIMAQFNLLKSILREAEKKPKKRKGKK